MINHYGTTPLIRQCVTPGMMAMHEGRTYRVSAVIQERKWVYPRTHCHFATVDRDELMAFGAKLLARREAA